jgi:Fe-S-cluster containining protein
MARDSNPVVPAEPDVLRDKRRLAANESFSFSCHSGLPCFNRCCADVNIILTPLDVIRLARRLGLKTTEFLERHALLPVTKDLELPVVLLKMGDEPEKRCSFVGREGCTVYEHRPWACRMYPVGMAIPPARAGVEPEPVYFLFEDDFCQGHGERTGWTVEQWRRDQGVEEQEQLEAAFRDLVTHPWFIGGRKLDPRRMEMLFTACYDLDKFRSFVFDSTFLQRFELEPETVERIRSDDLELLRFGFNWLRFALFAEPTMTVRPDAPSSPREA